MPFEYTCKNNISFEELLKRISPKLKGITHKLNGRFTFFNADDLYQEALVHLWIDYKDGKLIDKTDSYILQGCYFYLKNYLRRVEENVFLMNIDAINEEGLSLGETLFLKDEGPQHYLDYLNNKMLVETIQNNGLTKREKEVLSLCLEGLTIREMAKRLSISHVRIVKIRTNIKRKSNYLLDNNKR